MNGTPSDDRLSAWLDNELPLDERAEVEQQLAESSAMRQEADELREVSELVRSLSPERAPEELQAAVMRSIERDTLLAGESASSRRGPSPRHNPRLILAAVAALVVAAFMMLTIGSPNVDPVEERPDIVEGYVPPAPIHANKMEENDKPEEEDESEAPGEGDLEVEPESR